MKETFYFSHDYNARCDPKIIHMRMELGWEAYGIYWAIIEKMCEQNENSLLKNYNVLAFEFNCSESLVHDVVEKYNLFEIYEEKFSNRRLLEHFEIRNNLKKIRSEAGTNGANARWQKADNKVVIANAWQTHTIAMAKNGKGKERKVKEKKENIYRYINNNLCLNINDYNKLLINYSKDKIDEILDKIENSKSNKKYLNLYLTANNWLKNNKKFENEKKPTGINYKDSDY